MASTATGEDFLDAVRRSGLLPDALVAGQSVANTADPRAVAAQFTRAGLLTPFQARQLLAGKTRGFFLSDKYKVLGLIGTGGMGHVYLCEHLVLRRLVAVKLLQLNAVKSSTGGTEGAIERFVREARAVAALDHPNIVRVHDMERAGTTPFMIMEYVDGSSLHHVVSLGMLSPARAADCIVQAAAGLQHAHENGLIHRDIKPGNLLLDRTGTVKLLDLGLARFKDAARNDNLTARYQQEDSAVVGTADYMSPEQAFNSPTVDIRSDLYSLGATFYFLLTGQAPFEGESLAQKLIAHQFREPMSIHDYRKDVPPAMGEVLVRLMAKSPDDRYREPKDLIEALKKWTKVPVPPPSAEEMPKMPPSAYRLGLVSSPQAAGVKPEPGSWDLTPRADISDLRSETPRAAFDSTGHSDRVAHPPVPTDPVSAPKPGAKSVWAAKFGGKPNPRGMGRRAWLLAGGGVVAAGVAGIAYWRGTRQDREEPTPSPTPAPGAATISIAGSGSTFIQPAMLHWAPIYQKQAGVKIDYSGIGSGRGVDNMIDRVSHFGCTDAPMSDAQLAKARNTHGEVIHVPVALGAVVATVNLPDLTAPLRITGPVLADIYLGRIRTWSHDSIAVANPSVKLPDLEITPVYRADNSGTSFIWTEFLSKSSAEWESKAGTGNSVKWPVGVGADKSNGLADAVSRKAGAIGYVELSFALERNLRFAAIKNLTGQFVAPDFDSVTAAANASLAGIKPDLRFSLTNAPGESSYPVAGCTWAVLYSSQPASPGAELVKFLQWVAHDGQAHLKDLRYAPLPSSLVATIDEKLASVRLV